MILKSKKEFLLLFIAISISLVLSEEVNGAESESDELNLSEETEETLKLLANYYRKNGRFHRGGDSYESYESYERGSNSRGGNRLSEVIEDLVEDKLRSKFGKNGRRERKFKDDSEESDERRDRSSDGRKETRYRENKDYRRPPQPKKYGYNDYANDRDHQ